MPGKRLCMFIGFSHTVILNLQEGEIVSAQIIKVEKITAGEQVYQNLRENIIANRWKADDKLPSETELASMYGVNRLTVRMALQRLNALGLVETRVGDGTYVKKFEFSEFINAVQDLYSEPKLMDDVCDFRKLIEVECARLAILRADPEEYEVLEKLCCESENYKLSLTPPVSAEQLDTLLSYDVKFHEQICIMSHNTLYTYCFMVARNAIEKYVKVTLKRGIAAWERQGYSLLEGDFRHRAILDAMRKKDFPLCKQLYDEMIDCDM